MAKSNKPEDKDFTKTTLYPYVIKSFNYKSGNPWTHNAIQVGEKYISIYPQSHFTPSEENKFRDEDDTATKMLDFYQKVAKPMIREEMGFETPSEKKLYPHTKVKIPVTKEEYETIKNLAEQQERLAEQGKKQYSVTAPLGDSCAEFHQTVLETITQGKPEAALVKRSPLEKFVAWPQSSHDKAGDVAKLRYAQMQGIEPPAEIKTRLDQAKNQNTFWKSLAQSFKQSQIDKRDRLGLNTKKFK